MKVNLENSSSWVKRVIENMIKTRDILLEETRYYYHATLPENLPDIVTKGLVPSEDPHWGGDLGKKSTGKIFVTDKFQTANYYGNILWRNRPYRYRPILRFAQKIKLTPDATHDFYAEQPIKARFEIFVYDENTKFTQERDGDVWFDECTGHWRPLTYEIASAIASGEWDDPIDLP
jgi:hypothetical protein